MKAQHFKGKSVPDHLKEARTRGALAASEVHGTEMPGHLGAGADAAKDTAISLALLWILLSFTSLNSWVVVPLYAAGWCIWKTGRSALLGWARMERFHRVIEEERWEIEHHRAQERLELTEMYQAKGLTGKLLEEVVDVLMADDNRLLRVMLEEELGLTLEAYEHPLKQAMGALIGSLAAALLSLFGLWVYPSGGLLFASALVLILASFLSAKLERNHVTQTIIWSLAIATFACGAAYFLKSL